MPFSVILLPTNASPSVERVEATIRSIVQVEVGPLDANGMVRPPGLPPFALRDNAFALKRLSPVVCRTIFDAARRTKSYVLTSGRAHPPLMIRGSAGEAPEDLGPATVVADPSALCRQLKVALTDWDHDIAQAQADGDLDANDQPIEPPPEPGAAPRLDHDNSGVADKCAAMVRQQMKHLGWKITRTLVTQDPKWGIVWRADVETPDADPVGTREVCWRRAPPHAGFVLSSHPMIMFDPKESLTPLPPE